MTLIQLSAVEKVFFFSCYLTFLPKNVDSLRHSITSLRFSNCAAGQRTYACRLVCLFGECAPAVGLGSQFFLAYVIERCDGSRSVASAKGVYAWRRVQGDSIDKNEISCLSTREPSENSRYLVHMYLFQYFPQSSHITNM